MPTDTLTDVSPATALANLAQLHAIPPAAGVYPARRDGHLVLHVAVTPDTAEQWRAALAAPPFTEHRRHLHYTTWATQVMWMGAEVNLTYPQP